MDVEGGRSIRTPTGVLGRAIIRGREMRTRNAGAKSQLRNFITKFQREISKSKFRAILSVLYQTLGVINGTGLHSRTLQA